MKLSLALVATLASTSLLLAPQVVAADDDYDVCYDLKPGQPCKNAQGQDSRCSHRSVCIQNLTECPSGSTLLQSCSSTREAYCYPLFEGKPLLCLDDVNIETTVQRDVCMGKSDGTPCGNAFCEGNGKAGLTAAVYEQEGACEDSYCLATIFTKCNNVAAGTACTDMSVSGGKRRSFTGTCKTEEPFRPWCKSNSDGTILGDAKVLVAPAKSSSTSSLTSAPTSTPSQTPTSSGPASNSTKSSTEESKSSPTSTPAPTTVAPASGTPGRIASSVAVVASAVLAVVLA